MENKTVSLSNSEWRIMENLWEQHPKTATQLIKAMEAETGWAKSTTKTLLKRMEQKGCIAYRDGEKAREYYPLLKREEAVESETSRVRSDGCYAGDHDTDGSTGDGDSGCAEAV